MTLKFMMWNVQHGSAAHVQTPNGKNLAIDLGAGDNYSPLNSLRWAGLQSLDQVIITHPHMDHIDDILNFDQLAPKALTVPRQLTEQDIRAANPTPNPEAERKIRKYLEIKQRYSGPVSPQENALLSQNNGGVSIKLFTPQQSSKTNLNNHSVVTILEYSGVKILVPGDNEASSWQELLNRRDFVDAINNTHVLVAAHHGRESGFYRPLFQHISPLLTLVSDGRVVDTSVTDRYTQVSRGWSVKRRNGGQEKRYCVTTRNDGIIEVNVSPTRTLSVTVG